MVRSAGGMSLSQSGGSEECQLNLFDTDRNLMASLAVAS